MGALRARPNLRRGGSSVAHDRPPQYAGEEPTQADIERRFPDWQTWKGTDQLFHARRVKGAALTVRGEDWLDLGHEIQRAEAMLEESRPAGRA